MHFFSNNSVKSFLNLLACSLLWSFSLACNAATINVTAIGAAGDMDTIANGNCSFPEAIQASNTNTMVDACIAGGANDVLELPTGADFTAINGNGFNALTEITGSLTINGNASTLLRDASADKFRLMEVDPAEMGAGPGGRILVTINDLSFENGDATDALNPTKNGGALLVDGFVVFTCNKCRFINNVASNGGALHLDSTAIGNISDSSFDENQASNHGGAIGHFARGEIVIEDSEFTANTAGMHGGAIHSPDSNGDGFVYMYDSVLDDNSADSGWGGGIASLERAQLHDCKISNNSAQFGGGVYHGGRELFLLATTLSGNSASAAGGGLFIDGLAIKTAIYRSSIHDNTSLTGAGIAQISNQISDIRMGQSTVSGNKLGQQIYSDRTMFLLSSTIIGNGLKPALEVDGSSVLIYNTVISATDTTSVPVCDLAFLALPNVRRNWMLDSSCSGSADGDPRLGPLTDNGGTSLSHQPLEGSPLIGIYDQSLPVRVQFLQRLRLKDGTITTDLQNDDNELDQLGKKRNQIATDIGSVEYQAPSNDSFIVIPLPNNKAVVVPL